MMTVPDGEPRFSGAGRMRIEPVLLKQGSPSGVGWNQLGASGIIEGVETLDPFRPPHPARLDLHRPRSAPSLPRVRDLTSLYSLENRPIAV